MCGRDEMTDNLLEKVAYKVTAVALVLVSVMFICGLGLMLYGRLAKHETVTVEVIDKHIVRQLVCSKGCFYVYRKLIITPSETYHTSRSLYDQIQAGKTYTFYVSGWPDTRFLRHIDRILE